MAMTEIGGLSETSQGSGLSTDVTPPPPPFSQTLTSKYQNVRHIDSGEPTVSVTVAVLVGVACLTVGAIVGFLLGKFV